MSLCHFWHLCQIFLVLLNLGSGAVGITHLHSVGCEDGVVTLIERVRELSVGFPEGRLELNLIGGFADNRNYSESVFQNIMRKYTKFSLISLFFFVSLVKM